MSNFDNITRVGTWKNEYVYLANGVKGNPFRAAFAINLFLWSLGVFEGWGE